MIYKKVMKKKIKNWWQIDYCFWCERVYNQIINNSRFCECSIIYNQISLNHYHQMSTDSIILASKTE